MTQFTSFITENTPIPDPPHLRIIGMIISAVMMFVFVLIILFVVFEFSMDMLGFPIQLTDQFYVNFEQDRERENILKELPREMSLEEILSRFSILSPLPNSCVPSGEVTILCTWDLSDEIVQGVPFSRVLLRVDNIPVSWDVQFGKNTWLARLWLEPGVHRILIMGIESKFFVAGSELQPPENWKPLSIHQDIGNPNRCQECHHLIDRSDDMIRKGHALTLGHWKGNESCLECHRGESFTKKHFSIAAPETNCQSCHSVHGTVESEKLLKYPKKDFY
ncbi:MAG: cytochrome c3 family protein [Planctomycetaceae bacterium]|nr:cytochrome c3 family protein [Planctomycetaceae bacterium]